MTVLLWNSLKNNLFLPSFHDSLYCDLLLHDCLVFPYIVHASSSILIFIAECMHRPSVFNFCSNMLSGATCTFCIHFLPISCLSSAYAQVARQNIVDFTYSKLYAHSISSWFVSRTALTYRRLRSLISLAKNFALVCYPWLSSCDAIESLTHSLSNQSHPAIQVWKPPSCMSLVLASESIMHVSHVLALKVVAGFSSMPGHALASWGYQLFWRNLAQNGLRHVFYNNHSNMETVALKSSPRKLFPLCRY